MRMTKDEWNNRNAYLSLSLLPPFTWEQCIICGEHFSWERYYSMSCANGNLEFIGCQKCCKDSRDAYKQLFKIKFENC